MKRIHRELIRAAILLVVISGALCIAPTGCENMTPDQINATTTGIASVVTTTGQVVTPIIVNLQNGQSVHVKKVKVLKPSPTPKSS